MSRPFQLLKTITDKELIDFQKLLDSGYITSNERLGRLLKILERQALLHESFTPELQYITYKALFSDEIIGKVLNKPQSKKLNNNMNDLLRAAEKFLMFEEIKNTNDYDATILYPALINRKQIDLCDIRVKAAEKKLDTIKKKGVEYYNQYFLTQHTKANLLFINKKLEKVNNYDKLQEVADVRYLLQKLPYHLAKITLQRRYTDKTFNLKPFEALQNLLEQPEYESNPLIKLYLLNINLVEKEEEDTFLALKKLLREKQAIIPENFLKPIYTNLINHCTYQFSKGDLNYLNYVFEIYKDMHEINLLIKNSGIDIGMLKNIITAACLVKDFDWAVNQLAYYVKYVPKKVRKSVFEYNTGIIAFNQGKYDEVLKHFSKVNKIDGTYELSLRVVQLQSYYETDIVYEIGTQQIIDSLKTYIYETKKITERQKPAYSNFISIFNDLYKFKDAIDKRTIKHKIEKKLPKIKNRLSQFDAVKEKQWLLNKIEYLENSH